VYFVDYGRSKNINLGNLINLPKQFYKLPYQAVRAALYGKYTSVNYTTCLYLNVSLVYNIAF